MIGSYSIGRSGSHDVVDNELVIRWGTESDIAAIKTIADREKRALGFVHRGSLARAVERNELIVASVGPSVAGFCQFYRRRDGIVTVYHVAVDSKVRGKGIGRAMFAHVQQYATEPSMSIVRLKCPADLPANEFYAQNGFLLIAIEAKNARPLNVWELRIRREGTIKSS